MPNKTSLSKLLVTERLLCNFGPCSNVKNTCKKNFKYLLKVRVKNKIVVIAVLVAYSFFLCIQNIEMFVKKGMSLRIYINSFCFYFQ